MVLLLFIFATASSSLAVDLNPEALKSWDDYIAVVKLRIQERVNGARAFLWIDEDPTSSQHLSAGEIFISPLGNSHPLSIPHGLIHHWIGAVFIPGATIEDLGAVVHNYGSYNEIYRPTLVKAELLNATSDEQNFSILWVQRMLFLTAAFYTELDSDYVALNSRQGYMTFSTTRVQQIENYGEKDERRLAPDEGNGYLWRLVSFARFEERDGGLYLELEVIGLSKDLPGSLRFLLKPVIDHVPKQLLTAKLDQTRRAIRSRSARRISSALLPTAR